MSIAHFHDAAGAYPPLDFYVYGDRPGILPLRQRTRRMGRHNQSKRLAHSFGTSGNFPSHLMRYPLMGFTMNMKAFFMLSYVICFSFKYIQFLGASVLCILGEIGGIITLNIVQIQVSYSFPYLSVHCVSFFFLVALVY